MTVSHLPLWVLAAGGTFCVLLTVLYAFLLVKTFEVRQKQGAFVFYLLFFFLNLTMLQGIGDTCNCVYFNPALEDGWFACLPAAAVAAALAVLTAVGILSAVKLYGSLSTELTPASLMEGLDMLPDGICYSTASGVPLLVNSKMQSICIEAFGTAVLDTDLLEKRFNSGEVAAGCAVTGINDSRFLHLGDGSVWNIVRNDLMIKRMQVREIIAYEVTEEYEKSRRLEQRTQHLAEVNRQLHEYSSNLDEIIREREILSAKIHLHDDVGRSLLALRAYIAQQNISREQLVALWKFTVAVLRREAVSDNHGDRMEALREAAKAVDVSLNFDGEIPAEPELNRVIALAVRECLTNTVKHADGSELTVKTREKDGAYTVEITNDGRQPDGAITERGGLRNLRRAVEMNGGEMETEFEPRFLLRLKLREKYE